MPERYWVPTSLPWRIPCLGSWLSQKVRKQLLVGDALRVEDHEHDLVVAGAAGAHLLVGRVRCRPASVADGGHEHAVAELPELPLRPPEAAEAEDRLFHALRIGPPQRAAVDEVPLGGRDRRLAPPERGLARRHLGALAEKEHGGSGVSRIERAVMYAPGSAFASLGGVALP